MMNHQRVKSCMILTDLIFLCDQVFYVRQSQKNDLPDLKDSSCVSIIEREEGREIT